MKIQIDHVFLAMPLAWFMGVGIQAAELPVTPGPFQPAWESLAENSVQWPGKIGSIRMLGGRGKLKFSRDESGLHLTLPDKKPCDIAFALKITR
jgi:alpha-L-fucosidase